MTDTFPSHLISAALTNSGIPVTREQLRQWAARGKIRRCGKDQRGRTLYDVREVHAYATRHAEKAEVA